MSSSKSRLLWPALVCLAFAPRILGAFFLPNAFGDAYVYIRDIGVLSTRIKAGTFALADLYGFWLPLYQFISALINVFIGNGFYAGKIVSAVFGAGVCLLVYALTLQLVTHRIAALLAFVLIAVNPLHILNSASAMTDIPHAFLVLAALYFSLRSSWIWAAVFAMLAGFTRVESWMFIALIPVIQYFKERRISVLSILIMLLAPLLWFHISWKATGDWLACFRTRQEYHDWLLSQNPALGHFSFSAVIKDGAMLLTSTDVAVFLAALVAGWLVLQTFIGKRDRMASRRVTPVIPHLLFFFAFLALLVIAYLTHQVPIVFPRYGLILFSVGIPILAWTYFAIIERRPHWSRKLLIAIIVLCVLNAGVQTVGSIGEWNRYSVQRAVADYLRTNLDPNSPGRIFCDEDTVTVLSGIPAEKFVTSAAAPKDREEFLRFLLDQKVRYLVYIRKPNSTPARLFTDAEFSAPESFELVMHRHADFLRSDIWVFKVRETER